MLSCLVVEFYTSSVASFDPVAHTECFIHVEEVVLVELEGAKRENVIQLLI